MVTDEETTEREELASWTISVSGVGPTSTVMGNRFTHTLLRQFSSMSAYEAESRIALLLRKKPRLLPGWLWDLMCRRVFMLDIEEPTLRLIKSQEYIGG